jgi:hypothetical protein
MPLTDSDIQKAMPSFEEFKRNPEKWLGRDDDMFSEIDRGSTLISAYVEKQKYEFMGYRCNSLEEVERVASNMGYQKKDLTYVVETRPNTGYKCDLLFRIMPKSEKAKRDSWK